MADDEFQQKIAEVMGVKACEYTDHDDSAHHHQQLMDDSGQPASVAMIPCNRPDSDCPPCDYFAPKFQRVDGVISAWWNSLEAEDRASIFVEENPTYDGKAL